MMMYWNSEEFKDRLHLKKLHLLSNHIWWALENLCTLWQCKWRTPYMPWLGISITFDGDTQWVPCGYLASVMVNKNDMLIFTPCNTLSHGHYQNKGTTPSEIELGLPWRHLAWALILIMPTTSGIALHLSSGVVKLG
jgi:hypothetical protein